jgi:hypothetical protein
MQKHESFDDLARKLGISTPANRQADILLHAGHANLDFGDTLRIGTTALDDALKDKRFRKVTGQITACLESAKDYLEDMKARNPDKELEIRINDSIPRRLKQPEVVLIFTEIKNDPKNPQKMVAIIGPTLPIKRDEDGNPI